MNPRNHSLPLSLSDDDDWDDETTDLRDPDQPPCHEYHTHRAASPPTPSVSTPITRAASAVPLPPCKPLSCDQPPPPPQPTPVVPATKCRVAPGAVSLSEQLKKMKVKLKSRKRRTAKKPDRQVRTQQRREKVRPVLRERVRKRVAIRNILWDI